MTTRFAGRTALVTGAGRGISHPVTLQLAATGASLILTARSAAQLAQTRHTALAQGALPGQVHIVPADLGDSGQRPAAVGRGFRYLGHAASVLGNAAQHWARCWWTS